MNREILFRGKRSDNGQWIEGFLIKTEEGLYYIFNYHFIPTKSIPSNKFIEVIPETVGQLRYVKGEARYFDGDIYYHAGYGYETVSDLCELQYSLIIGYSEDIGEIKGNIHDKE